TDGKVYRTGVPAVPARGHEALPEGRAVLHGQVRDREAQRGAGTARAGAQSEARGIRRTVAREAEGQAHLRRARESVPPLLRSGRSDEGHHGRAAAPDVGAPARQRRLPAWLRDVAAAGAPARAPWPFHGQRQEGRHSVLLGPHGRRRRSARLEWAEPDDSAPARAGQRARGPRMALARADGPFREGLDAANARADQSAGAGAAHCGVVFEIIENLTLQT